METETKAEQLVTKLIRETNAGKVLWKTRDAPTGLVRGTEDFIPLFFDTIYKGKHIGIYLKRFKSFVDESEFFWSETVGLCITDYQDRVVWELEERSPALYDLFKTAREQASGIGNLLDDLLED